MAAAEVSLNVGELVEARRHQGQAEVGFIKAGEGQEAELATLKGHIQAEEAEENTRLVQKQAVDNAATVTKTAHGMLDKGDEAETGEAYSRAIACTS